MELAYSFTIQPAPSVKPQINVGACLDIPTGKFLRGRHGEMILNGGFAIVTGVVGAGNSFKTTLADHMVFTGLGRFTGSIGSAFDTETNKHEWRERELFSRVYDLHGEDIIETGRYVITDKTVYSGNKWHEKHREFCDLKIKSAAKHTVDSPFLDRKGDKLMGMLPPTFTLLDSFTEFSTDDVEKMREDNELGESGANTIHMRQGLSKMQLLMEAPGLNGASYNYLIMTAHIGKDSEIQSGPSHMKKANPTKLRYLGDDLKIKGTTEKFTFLTHVCLFSFKTNPLMQADGDGPLYPKDSEDKMKYDTDLNALHVKILRAKSGISGISLVILASQKEGILPSLTEFHNIKENDRFGLDGTIQSYALDLYPEVKLSRTTVRTKIDDDFKLRRALNITSELLQMYTLWGFKPEDKIPPKQIYKSLVDQGYDMDIILGHTRGWWTVNNDDHPLLFLSTMDILNMVTMDKDGKPLYHPYWLEDDNKTIKKEYLR